VKNAPYAFFEIFRNSYAASFAAFSAS